LKGRVNAGGHADVALRQVDRLHRITQRLAGGEIEGEGGRWKLTLVVDRKGVKVTVGLVMAGSGT